MKSRILLTGSSGFLGKQILKIIDNESIFTLNRTISSFNVDLSKEVPTFTDSFEYIIHSAGKAHSTPKTEIEKSEFFKVNVIGTKKLLLGLSKNKFPKYFVFISSVSVYGLVTGININEKQPLNAIDPYGQSKIQAEQLVIEWCKKHNVLFTILRLPLLVGENPPGNLGAIINGIKKGYYFNITDGSAKKSMVLAEDVAKNIFKVAEIGGIYNLTDGYHPSFAELSNHIAIQLGKRRPMNMPMWLAIIIANFGDLLVNKASLNTNKLLKMTSDLTFDDSKAREVFGWNPTPVLEGFKISNNAQ